MRKQVWVILFLVALAGHIAGIQFNSSILQNICKSILMPLLIGYFLSQTESEGIKQKRLIIVALLFSMAGDALLMFQEEKPIFFLLGLSAFLLAHIFYIIFFQQIRMKERVMPKWWLLLLVIVHYAGLIIWLSPYLKDMKIPVRVYGVVISLMFVLALHMQFIRNKEAARWMMAGAILFVASDSLLAINKFYKSFELAGVLIMLTYGLAQLFIVKGAARYISSDDNK